MECKDIASGHCAQCAGYFQAALGHTASDNLHINTISPLASYRIHWMVISGSRVRLRVHTTIALVYTESHKIGIAESAR